MRLIILTAALVSLFGASAKALTLVCEMQNHGTSRINAKIIDSWVPRKQTHILNLDKNSAYYHYYDNKFPGKIVVANKNRIQWKYVIESVDDKKREIQNTEYKYIYLRKKRILMATVEFSGRFLPIENVKGTCVEK